MIKKVVALAAIIFAFYSNTMAQCNGCTMTINFNTNATFTLTSTDVLCFTGGIFTGSISAFPAGAKICVSNGAEFNPTSMPNPSAGTIIVNVGSSSILPAITTANGFKIDNYGTVTCNGTLTLSGISTFNNYEGCSMTISQNFTLATTGSSITNKGTISFSGTYTGNNSTNVYNYGYFNTASTFVNGSSFKNYGRITANGNVTFNAGAGSLFHNYCTLISNGNITNLNTTNTLNNYGLIIADVAGTTISNGNNTPTRPSWFQTPGAFTIGANYINYGNVSGRGDYYFTGTTTNAAGSTFGNDGLEINFFDTGMPVNIMDVETVVPNASVTKYSYTPPTRTDLVTTCNITTNKGPVAADDYYITSQSTEVFGNVFSNDIDPENNTLTLGASLVAIPQHFSSFNLFPNGDFSYVPTDGYYGTDMFIYSVCDNGVPSKCDSASVSITINQNPIPMPSCDNPGTDPSTTLGSVPNTYFPGTANANAGATSITIGPHASGDANQDIAIGDKLMIIQIQGADINTSNNDSYGDGITGGFGHGILYNTANIAGVYEFVTAANTISAATGGILNIESPLVYSYINTDYGAQGQRRFQVIKVPQYNNLQLTADITIPGWNGTTGGIFCISVANTLDMNGHTINAKGKGFRGGGGRMLNSAPSGSYNDYLTFASVDHNGSKGEGIAGTPQYLNNNGVLLNTTVEGYPGGSYGQGAPGNAGGGGTDGSPTDNQMNTGGGGGANGGFGGKGGNAWSNAVPTGGEPGMLFMAANANRLVFGGGGGAASTNNGTGDDCGGCTGGPFNGFASSGAAGGGLVVIYADRVTNSGTIDVSGNDANSTVLNDASGGGGAGGSVLLVSNNSLTGITVLASGGNGGNNFPSGTIGNFTTGAPHGPGGGGGGGVIYATSSINYASTVRGGVSGLTSGPIAYGATNGYNGKIKATVKKSELPSGFLGCYNYIVASNDDNITTINTAVSGNVLFNDFDVEGNTVGFTGFYDQPTSAYVNTGSITVAGFNNAGTPVSNAGTLAINTTGAYTFTPANNFIGYVTLAYKITDNYSYLAIAYANLTIHVIEECDDENNVAPINDNVVTYMNVPYTSNVLINDIDPQGDSLLFNGFINPSNASNYLLNGSITISGKDRFGDDYINAGSFSYGNNGTYTYTPVSHFTGSININYEICDDNANQVCKKANLKISVEPTHSLTQNDYPYAGENAAFTYMDVPLNGSNLLLNAGDANAGDIISINTTPVSAPAHGTLTINSNGTYLYTPTAGYTGPDRFIYQICDNASTPACSQGVVYIDVLKSEVKITDQPDNQNICAGTNTNFSVTATGTNLTHQWQVSTNGGALWSNLSNGGVYSNVTTNTLTITNTVVGMNNYLYRCNLTTDCDTQASDSALLTIGSANVAIDVNPENASICDNSNALFTVSATGPALTYQWEESTNNGASWNNISNGGVYSGANNDSLTLTSATSSMNGFLYRCIVASSCATSATSTYATLLVGASAITIVTPPANTSECSGTSANFSVSATGPSLTYQWQENTGSGWTNLSNSSMYEDVTIALLTINNITTGMDNYQYRCVVSSACASSVNSNAATLDVITTPTITNTTQGDRCGNGPAVLTATASAGTINWYDTFTGGSSIGTGTSFTTPDISTNTYYYVDATFNGCRTPSRANVLAAVITDLPSIVSQPSNVAICEGSYHTFSIIASTNVTGYQWQVSTNGGSNWTSIIDNSLYSGALSDALTIMGVSASMTGYQYRCVASSTCTPDAVSNAAILTVNFPPVITNTPVRAWVCAGSNASFSVTASGSITGYQWQLSTNAGVNWSDITNNGTYSGATTATLSITGATVGMNNYLYRCAVTGTCSPATTSSSAPLVTNTNTVTINTNPTATSACAATPTSLTVVASGPGLTYQWQYDAPGGGTNWVDIVNGGIYSNATTSILNISDVSTVDNYRYRCVVSSTCATSANSTNATVTLNTLVPTITVNPGNSTICEATNTTFSVTATVPAGTITYQWQTSTDGGTNWSNTLNAGVYSGANSNPLNLTGATIDLSGNRYRCRIASTSTTVCPANSGNGLLTINPLPDAPTSAQSDRDNFCADDAGNINLSVTGGSGTTVRWFTGSCGGTDIGTGNPLSIASPATSTTYYARWENGCGNSTCASVDVTVRPLATAPTLATTDRTNFCTNDAGDINLTASGGTGTLIRWYTGSCGGTDVGSGNPLTLASPTATTTYYAAWENACGISSCANVTINIDQMPDIANAGPDQTSSAMCGLTSTALAANNPVVGTGLWNIIAGSGGSVTTPASATSNFSGLVSTPYTLRWTTTNGACSSFDDVNISFFASPSPTLTSDDGDNTFCTGTTVIFTGGGGTNYNFRVNTVSVQNGASNTYATNALTNGQVVDVIVTNAAGCNATSAGITNTVNALPAAPTASSPQTFVGSATINDLVASVPGGTSLYWYANGSGGVALAGGTSLSDNTVYYAESQNNTTLCTSAARTPVTAVIYPYVTLSINNATIAEAAGTAIITATLSHTFSNTVTVNLAYTGTATGAGTDYNTTGASITIPSGSLTGTVTITSVNDAMDENDETVIVDISSVTNGNESGTQQVTTTITDDDAAPTVTLGINNATITENAGTAIITATLNAISSFTVTVNLAYTGTATGTGTDYNTTGASITIPAGSLTGTVTITSVNDAIDENNETVIVDITTVTNGTESGVQQVTTTINDDDAAPTVTLSIDNATIAEAAGSATVTATLNATSGLAVTVNLGYTGTATGGGTDYNTTGASINIPAGSLTGTVTITSVNDAIDENNETVITDITTVTNGTESGTQQVTTTITDDDAAPTVTLSINNATIAENAGTATVTATISAASGLPVSVNLGYTGTASGGGTDYNTSGASIVIPAGSLSGTVTITSVNDAIDENNETVIVDVTTVTNGTESGTQQVTTTITDDDDAPTVTLSINNATIAENAGTATVTATLSGISSFPVTVDLAYTGTATGTGTDYNTTGASITIPAGSLTGTVTITSVNDAIDENNETVITDITSVTNGTESGTQQVTTTITDDDAAPSVTLGINNVTIAENAGTATVTATLSAVSGLAVTVNLGYTGTATGAGTDYNVSGASIVIPAGSLTGTVTITSVNDAINENNETVITDITSVTNGTESGTQQVTTTITDDDAAPSVTLGINNVTIAENAGNAIITATLSAVSGLAVTVNLGYTGTATGGGTDYNTSGASITIPAGSLTGTVTITSVNDAIDENNETVITDITSVTNGTESGTQQVTTTITDDDAAPSVTLSINNATIIENAGTATVTATISAVSGLPVTVDLGYTGTAIGAGTDYNVSGASIVIPAGSLTGTVTITSVSDALDENDETVIADITAVTNGTESGSQQVTTTITDDDAEPLVSLSIDLATLAENADVATLTATLDAPSGKDVTVNLAFSGTATGGGADYTESANSIFIPAGSLTGTITFTVVQDFISEGDETIITDITSVTNGTENGIQQVTATITDDEGLPLVTLSIDNLTIVENAGVATITATLDAVSSKDVTVNLGFSGTATGGGADYNLSGPSITILAGFLTGTITVTAVQDLLFENDETLIADITGAINAAENGVQQVTTTVTDDDTAPLVALSIDNSTISENSGIATITATLDAISGLPVTVDLSFSGTAIGGGIDYNTTTSITIPAGSLTGTVTIAPIVDLIDEYDETVVADITSVTNGTESGTQQVTTTISDSDAEPSVRLAVDQPTIAENSGVAIVTATLNTVSAKNIIVYLGFSGTATGTGADYSITTDSIIITAGSLTGTTSITSVQDAIFEGDESIIADITSVTNGTEDGTQSITTTITDDEGLPQVTLSIDSTLIQEFGGVATITATLDVVSASDVTINLGITGTAADGTDYNSSASTITILAGATTGTITISAVDDAIDENDESVIVDIISVTNAAENGTQQVSTTIVDNDNAPLVTLAIDQPAIAENGGIATITATLDAVSAKDVTITINLTGIASNSVDYTSSSTTIIIPAGSTEGTITVTTIDDATDEYDETIIADISSVVNGTEDGTQQFTTTITDDDAEPLVTLTVDQNFIAEHLQVATITAILNAVSGKDITVKLGFTGTAIGNTDYTFSDSTITIPAGLLDGNILIIAQPDLIYEGTETVITDIATVTNASEDGTQQVLVTITDDNAPPLVTLSVDQNTIPENSGVAIITASLDAVSTKDVTVYFGYAGTATGSNTDYNVTATSITIPAGSTEGTVTITAIQDTILEGGETVITDIDSVTNGTENGTQQITVTIVDDEVANQIPIAIDDIVITNEDSITTINVLGNDFGLGDGGIVVTIPRNGQHGTAVVNGDNTVTYTPLPNYYGVDTIKYQVCDINNDCDTAYILINLNSVDDIPLANNDTISVVEDNQVTVDILANDTGFGDGGITVSLIFGGNNGSYILNGDNTITYTPNPNYFGSDTIVYQVCDSDGDCDTATVTIAVTEDNHIPVVTITNKYITTTQDVPVTVCMTVTDDDNDTIKTTSTVKIGSVVKNDTSYCFTYTPNTGYTGNDTLILTFCDSRNACVTDTVWITVTPGGTKPQAANDTIYLVTTIDKEVQGCIAMIGSTDGLVASIISSPAYGTTTISNQLCVNYKPNSGSTETDQFIVTVCNPQGLCDTVVVVIDVLDLKIPDGFSPNGDGLNEHFVIQGLEAYDKVSVQIFNRWGNKVFESEIYKNDWDGTSQNAFKLGSSKLPAGTYFYIIDFHNGQKPQLGSIYLSR